MKGDTIRCTRCKEVKDITMFYKDSSTRSGVFVYCKECCRLRVKKDVARNLANATQKRSRERFPLKARARSYLQYVVSTGKVKKEACFLCGEKKADGHHLLYEFKEKVIWLCRKHHSEVHYQSKIDGYEEWERRNSTAAGRSASEGN